MSHLVEVGNLRNLIPQVAHYHGVTSEAKSALDTILSTECGNGCKNTGQRRKNSKKIILTESESEIPTQSCQEFLHLPFFAPLAAALHDSELDGEAVEVILVEVSVIVQVVEVAHQELDPVVPAVVCSHLKTG